MKKTCIYHILLFSTAIYANVFAYYSHCNYTYEKPKYDTRYQRNGWATHTCIDLAHCSYQKIRSPYDIEHWLRQICSHMGVITVQQPTITYHQAGNGFFSGYSLTLHANGHTDISIRANEQINSLSIDIFSSQPYNPDELIDFTKWYFNAKDAIFEVFPRY